MGTGLERALNFCLAVCLLPSLLQDHTEGLEIPDPAEVERIHTEIKGVAGGSVTLSCGSTLPSIYIWSYTPPGANTSTAVAYSFGHGPKIQQFSESLGNIQVPLNTSSLIVDKLQPTAKGLYTCQAIYDTPERPTVALHYVQLDVLEDGEPGSGHL